MGRPSDAFAFAVAGALACKRASAVAERLVIRRHWLALVVLLGVGALVRTGHAEEEESDEEDASAPPPAAAPVRPPIKVEIENGMVRVAGATFIMGSNDEKAPPNERPAHSVKVKPFFIDRTEVTVRDYRACVEQKGCAPPQRTSNSCTFALGDGELPINCVRYIDADTFCRAMRKRLPTEAEWELAARGPSPIVFPWGNAPPTCALAATLQRPTTHLSCTGARPARVGSRPAGASPYGALDMSGNVEEWVQDFYSEHVARVTPRAGSSRVLRGGGFLSSPTASRATTRNWGSLSEAGPNVGFRCARD